MSAVRDPRFERVVKTKLGPMTVGDVMAALASGVSVSDLKPERSSDTSTHREDS